jgi:GINS complex subunit 4
MMFIEENTIDMRPEEKDLKLKLLIVESELERVKFLIRGYLRMRLAKIDKYTLYIQQNEGLLKRLSTEEVQYMQR